MDFYIGSKSSLDETAPTNGIGGMRECSNPFGVGWMRRERKRVEDRKIVKIG